MLVKLKCNYDKHLMGDIVEMELSTARRLISQGWAVLASTQEQMKAVTDESDKMIRNYENKQPKQEQASRPKRQRGRPRKTV